MNNIKTIATYIGLTVVMCIMISVMMIQFLKVALPKNPVMEAKIPIMKERAEQRAEALKQLQKDYMKEHH
ncbi:hypothetical protein [Bacillus sp. PK5-004]